MTYKEKLEQTKSAYPFDRWREMFYPVMRMISCSAQANMIENQ
jgi:hypothetical protein